MTNFQIIFVNCKVWLHCCLEFLIKLNISTAMFQTKVALLATCVFIIQTLSSQAPKREFRGVWVAGVANTNWPCEPGITTSEQKYDVDAIHFDDYFYPYKIENQEWPDSFDFISFDGAYYPDRLGSIVLPDLTG